MPPKAASTGGLPHGYLGCARPRSTQLTGELSAPNITVTGWLSHRHMEQELSKLSVYLSTSTWEGLSMGVLHAMAMAKPLVLRRCTGNIDAVEHGRNGFLFDTVEEAAD